MPWVVYYVASGATFLWGALLLALAVVAWGNSSRRILPAILGALLIVISAEALPYFAYAPWVVAIIAWLAMPGAKTRRSTIAQGTLLLITLAMALAAASFQWRPSPPRGGFSRLYVVGDSITAGLGTEHRQTWPAILREDHGIEIVDLSQPGASTSQATTRVRAAGLGDGLVLIEIGGNDLLGGASARQFAQDLETLVQEAEGPGRKLIMLELPLYPFDNGFGLAQRRVARRHGVILIPRRFFIEVLSAPGATVDGIHPSVSGQRRLAEMIWGFVGPAMAAPSATRPTAQL
jgi:acyl-CoA thioesterase-1